MTSNSTRFLSKALFAARRIGLGSGLGGVAAGFLRADQRRQKKAGMLQKVKVYLSSLEGSLDGNPAQRDVFVFVPL